MYMYINYKTLMCVCVFCTMGIFNFPFLFFVVNVLFGIFCSLMTNNVRCVIYIKRVFNLWNNNTRIPQQHRFISVLFVKCHFIYCHYYYYCYYYYYDYYYYY